MARTGIRLLTAAVFAAGEAIRSFDTERIIGALCFDVGVSKRVHGIDACVFVLLSEDVEPPVEVD